MIFDLGSHLGRGRFFSFWTSEAPVLAYLRQGEVKVERSVTESERTPRSRRVLNFAQGLLIGVAVCALVVIGFDWLMGPAP